VQSGTTAAGATNSDAKAATGGLFAKAYRMGAMIRAIVKMLPLLLALVVLVSPLTAHAQAVDVHGVVDTLLGKYKSAGQAWIGSIQAAATNLFWILALISLSWTLISMAIKQADLMEIVAELCRYIMVTGLFLWLLTNGATFGNDIIHSLWQVGGQATGTGQSIYPGDLITLGMQVFQQTLQHVNFLQPESIVAPIIIALIILIVCALIAVNMILLLCAAWIVVYAGLIFLGFGGCRWTSDMAINYYRTVLGVGISLMTMQLIIGIGVQFLQQLVASTGNNQDVGQIAIIMVATIILAVISHRLPHMVAGMVVGGGHNGAIGGVGIMTLMGAGIAGASLAARATGTPVGVAAGAVGDQAHNQLQQRISAAEAAMSAGSGSGVGQPSVSGGLTTGSSSATGTGSGGQARSGSTGAMRQPQPRGATTQSAVVGQGGRTATAGSGGSAGPSAGKVPESEPPQDRPMSPDEQRGFGLDGNSDPNGADKIV
jgi:type IV secretion system protein TrbL